MNKELVSVVVPAFNAEKHIESCISSLLQQSWGNIEIIVVDDGSTDHTAVKVSELSKKHSSIKYIRKKNGGVSSARNVGLDHAHGRYIALQDADDTSAPERIAEQMKYLNQHDLALCGCSLSLFGRKQQIKHYPENDGQIKANLLFLGRTVPGAAILFDRNRINNIRFNECIAYGEDFEFILNIAFNGNNKVGNLQKALYNYRLHDEQTTVRIKDTNRESMTFILNEFISTRGFVVKEECISNYYDYIKSDGEASEALLDLYGGLVEFLLLHDVDVKVLSPYIYKILKDGIRGSKKNLSSTKLSYLKSQLVTIDYIKLSINRLVN